MEEVPQHRSASREAALRQRKAFTRSLRIPRSFQEQWNAHPCGEPGSLVSAPTARPGLHCSCWDPPHSPARPGPPAPRSGSQHRPGALRRQRGPGRARHFDSCPRAAPAARRARSSAPLAGAVQKVPEARTAPAAERRARPAAEARPPAPAPRMRPAAPHRCRVTRPPRRPRQRQVPPPLPTPGAGAGLSSPLRSPRGPPPPLLSPLSVSCRRRTPRPPRCRPERRPSPQRLRRTNAPPPAGGPQR